MKILFWLYKSRVNKKGLTPVMMRITIGSKRINYRVKGKKTSQMMG